MSAFALSKPHTRRRIVVKELERRLRKLEAHAAVSAEAEMDAAIDRLIWGLTKSEVDELARIWSELGDVTVEELRAHSAAREIILRSTTRREKTFRTEVAIKWERKGLCLDLEALT